MATFVRVQSAGHGGWYYNRINPLPHAAGHLCIRQA